MQSNVVVQSVSQLKDIIIGIVADILCDCYESCREFIEADDELISDLGLYRTDIDTIHVRLHHDLCIPMVKASWEEWKTIGDIIDDLVNKRKLITFPLF